ncbi:MAG: hypothetical protein SPL37_01460 [Prevotella sp.]|nr:hypothetical protein [Prevotella sp.]
MKPHYFRYIVSIFSAIILLAVTACSTQKNTSGSRFWHAFNAKYNTYFNGAQAYIDGSLEKENGNKDNFTEMLPLYTVGNKNSRELGKGNFDRAIEKAEKAIARHSIKRRPEWTKNRKKTERDIEWLSRKEYNPFLWKAWMLMGRSQFFKGSFDEAAATFAYMSRLYKGQPAIYGKARAWLAKCYIEEDWLYDAEDVIRNMRRDSIDWRAQKEWDYTMADYYVHTKEYAKAIPYLRKVIKHEMRRKQKAREWYLMGQLQAAVDNRAEAYNAFKHVIRQNPPYELEFNARIAMTEVMARGHSKQMIGRLKRMAASDKNKDYLDQVYYAMGNIYLYDKDTTRAINAYEQGNKKATRSGIEKGVLLLHLGDLYWTKEKFSDAKRCYGEAIGLLDKDRPDYEQLSNRSKVLDELVPYTDAVQLQDSLQHLAKCPEMERNEAIDRVIDALKKKEKEERRSQAEQEQAQNEGDNGGGRDAFINNRNNRNNTQTVSKQGSTWYFYNPMAVSQGKETFQRQWGKRENTDNWQRANKTVVANVGSDNAVAELSDEQRDSIFKAEEKEDSLDQRLDSAQNDPHKREYYLAQIPFTAEKMAESNKVLEDGLHHSGVIFKDKLDNLGLAEKALRRLADNYSDYENMDDVFYNLYLLYMRKGELDVANSYIDSLKNRFPDSKWTVLLSDPNFVENSKFGVQIEDSLYAATYDAFRAGRYSEVAGNVKVSDNRFPLGANRDKFLFIGGLGKLNSGDVDGCLKDMKEVVEKFPQSRISEIAGMIVNGVHAGRRLRGGNFDIGSFWDRRAEVLNDSDSIRNVRFTPERNIDFKVMLVYSPDSLNENKLLFEVAKFNFTHFVVRNFDIEIVDDGGMHRMQLSGFRSFDEAYQYARELARTKSVVAQMNKNTRVIVISDKNLQLIGLQLSYNDYEKFYEKNFSPVQVTKRYLLSEPAEVATPRERDLQDEMQSKAPTQEDINEQQKEAQQAEETYTIPEEETVPKKDSVNSEAPADGVSIADTVSTAVGVEGEQPENTSDDNSDAFILPEEKPSQPSASVDKQKVTEKKQEPASESPMQPKDKTKPSEPVEKKPAQVVPKQQDEPASDEPVIIFDDDLGVPASGNNNTQQPTDDSIEDEYYDLDGF